MTMSDRPIRSRLAPTPSGYLHLGNACNFVLTWLLVRSQQGHLHLRIDDLDAARVRPAYLADVFRSLDWLGLDWDSGPQSPDAHQRHHSQTLRLDRYQQALAQLARRGPVFACTCSRRAVQAASTDGQYPGTCRRRALDLQGPARSWRLQTPSAAPIRWTDGWLGPQAVDLHAVMRDPVLRRRDGLPAYQLASVVDDLDQGTTLLVRGQDLLPSSAAQRMLAIQGEWFDFLGIALYHHPLLSDEQGRKLAKSAGSRSLQHLREAGHSSEQVYHWLGQQLGWPEPVRSAQEALARFRADDSPPPQLQMPTF